MLQDQDLREFRVSSKGNDYLTRIEE